MNKPIVTAVGRLLKPKGNEPRVQSVIQIAADGKPREVLRAELPRD